MEEIKDNQEKIEIKIDNADDALGWLEKMLQLIKEYGVINILKAGLLLILTCIVLYFTFNPNKIIDIYNAIRDKSHIEQMDIRTEITPKIQILCDKLTFKTNASRTLVLELHNGNTGIGGLPFTKCTATYESLNIGKIPVSNQYQEVNMSLIPFTSLLYKQGYWCGDIDSLETIDRGLYYKMKSNEVEHFAACLIEGVDDKAIAFMIVTFDKDSYLDTHNCTSIRDDIRHVAMELAVHLELINYYEQNNIKKNKTR